MGTRLPYNIETVTRALDIHLNAGLIRSWRYVSDFHFEVETTDGLLQLRSLREAYVFVNGLASASHAVKKGTARITPLLSALANNPHHDYLTVQ